MEGGPPSFPQGSSCPVVLGNTSQPALPPSPTGLSPSLVRRSRTLLLHLCYRARSPYIPPICPTTRMLHRIRPVPQHPFRLFPVRSPLLRESRLISLPPGTKMVQFPGCAHQPYSFQAAVPAHDDRRVTPFGHPWITACLRLPRAFRSSPRPSSPLCAKASTMCP